MSTLGDHAGHKGSDLPTDQPTHVPEKPARQPVLDPSALDLAHEDYRVGPMDSPDLFRLEKLVGRGSQGPVWRATSREGSHQSILAIKMLGWPEHPSEVDEQRRRSNMLQRRRHSNLVEYYEAFPGWGPHAPGQYASNAHLPDEPRYFYVKMEWVEGPTLYQKLERADRLTRLGSLRSVQEVGEALTYLHNGDPPLTHGDVKPSNVKDHLTRGAVLIDCDLAEIHQVDGSSSGAGTRAYMAPERQNGAASTIESDSWSLGVLAYWTLTGNTPQPDEIPGMREELRNWVDEAGMPTRLAGEIGRMLDPDPKKRPPIKEWADSIVAITARPARVRSRGALRFAALIAATALLALVAIVNLARPDAPSLPGPTPTAPSEPGVSLPPEPIPAHIYAVNGDSAVGARPWQMPRDSHVDQAFVATLPQIVQAGAIIGRSNFPDAQCGAGLAEFQILDEVRVIWNGITDICNNVGTSVDFDPPLDVEVGKRYVLRIFNRSEAALGFYLQRELNAEPAVVSGSLNSPYDGVVEGRSLSGAIVGQGPAPARVPVLEIGPFGDGPGIGEYIAVTGTVTGLAEGRTLWLLVQAADNERYHPVGPIEVGEGGRWSLSRVGIGGDAPSEVGRTFNIAVVHADAAASQAFVEYIEAAGRRDEYPGLHPTELPEGIVFLESKSVTRTE